MVKDDARMPLRQHLDELRRSLLRTFAGFIMLFAVGIYWQLPLLQFIEIPWETMRAELAAAGEFDPGSLIYIGPSEGMLFGMKVAFLFAVIVGAPFYLWELWRFVGVGLLPAERAAVRRGFLPAVVLLLLGMAFGYRLLLPLGLQFLVSYLPADFAVAQVTISSYLAFVVMLTLVMGMVFELPLVMWAVVRAGLVEVATLKRSRKLAMLGMLVFAAVATPPDPFTMVFVAVPMIVLYEAGLLLARSAQRARRAADERLL